MKSSLLLPGLLVGASCILSACLHNAREPATARSVSPAAQKENRAPGTPTGLRLIIVPGGFRLAWHPSPQDPGIVTGYEIVRATMFSGPYEAVARVGRGVFTYTDTTATPEHIYFYKVRALAGTEYSPFSSAATGEMPGPP